MDEFVVKLGMLEPFKRQELLDFLEFLLNKQTKEREGQFKTYKERILQVSVWNEDDIAELETSSKKLNQWPAPEW